MLHDNQIPIEPALLAAGFQDENQAKANLARVRERTGTGPFCAILRDLAQALSRSGDPDQAVNYLERFLADLDPPSLFIDAVHERPALLTELVTLFGGSRFLAAFASSTAVETLGLLRDRAYLASPVDKEALTQRLAAVQGSSDREDDVLRALRTFRKREMLRIGLRDLLGKADLAETVRELSDLAEAALQAAYQRAWTDLVRRYGKPLAGEGADARPAGFAVIAMGKLGGGELNFSSDVDLMYVYSADGETEGTLHDDGTRSGGITNHQFFVKLGERISSAIGANTADGFVFRVDMRLRPEGQRGPLAQSLGGYEIYYESWGQTWERSALIKARPVAGDPTVGREFVERITPFVYRKYLDFSALVEIRDMKQKINRDVELKGRTHRDVKLGYGGIREIEFLVQALQLIYGGRDRTLRERGTMRSLHLLAQKGLLTYEETNELLRAYVFLRTVEHRIQILNDLQTQTLPTAEAELRTLARRTGYLAAGKETADLLADHTEHTRKVRSIYDKLLAVHDGEAAEREKDEFSLLLDPDMAEQDAAALLRRYGFSDPAHAYRNITLLKEGQAFMHQTPRSRRTFVELFPQLFREVIASPDPDMALNHLESYLGAQVSWDSFQSTLQQDSRALPVLVSVFGSSEYFSRMLVRSPALIGDHSDATAAAGSKGALACRDRFRDAVGRAGTITDRLDALRYVKKREELHIGMADLAGSLSPRQVWKALSRLAEAALSEALRLADAEIARKYGAEPADGALPGLAILGAGKLGGREIIYGSDLDILIVYDESRAPAPPQGVTPFEHMNRIGEKVISYLTSMTREGAAYKVDTRLRPSGSKGPLVQSIEAYRSYFTDQAETWERQSVLSLRTVAGDAVVGRSLVDTLQRLIFRSDPSGLADDILSMRKRMLAELAEQNEKQYDIKQGRGGLVDIDFTAQYLLLRHGKDHEGLMVPGTLNALQALKKEGILDSADADALTEAYLFHRQLESRMRIVANQSTSILPRDPVKAGPLARRLGYKDKEGEPAGKQLIDAYEKRSLKVRQLFDRIVKA